MEFLLALSYSHGAFKTTENPYQAITIKVKMQTTGSTLLSEPIREPLLITVACP